MRDELGRLYEQAGSPPKGALKRHADRAGHSVGESTLIGVVSRSATGGLRWATVEAFVDACVGHAGARGVALPAGASDKTRWRARWERTYVTPPPSGDRFTAAREEYLARLRQRLGRVDTEILLPMTEQEISPVPLHEVFVGQAVRGDPPPVELPRELWRRLVETGEIVPDEAPDGIDRDRLDRLRRAYQERPARPVLQVVAEQASQRLVLLGDPGAGKSTLARYLALALARDNGHPELDGLAGWLPLLVELRTYADPRWRAGTFLDLVEHQHAQDGLGLPKAPLESFLRDDGRAVVIFDGLDELFDPRLRQEVTDEITGFAVRFPRVRVLVTSRPIGYRRQAFDVAGFSHHVLQDLDRVQIETFSRRWYHTVCSHDGTEAERLHDRLLAAIDDSPAIRELAGNPLLLTILAIIGRRRELPRSRHTVYEHAVTVLMEHWEVNKYLTAAGVDPALPRLDRDHKLELLRLIARGMQEAGAGLAGNRVAGSELLERFQTYLGGTLGLPPGPARLAARAMLQQLRERNFVLSRFGGEVYGFVHRAFLEYFAAADIVDRFDHGELSEDDLVSGLFGQRWRDPAWHEVLLLVVGMKERLAGRIVDHLLSADPLWFFDQDWPQHLLLAIRCLGEASSLATLAAHGELVVDMVIDMLETASEWVLSDDSPQAVERAVLPVLAALGSAGVGRDRYLRWYLIRGQSLLADSMFGSRPVVLLAARVGAALLADSHTFHDLMRAQAAFGPDGLQQTVALSALVEDWPEDPGTLRLLRKCAAADRGSGVREFAIEALARGWREHSDVRRLVLQSSDTWSEEDSVVREAAVRALATGWPDDPGTFRLLRECVDDEFRAETQHVKWAAMEALATGWPDHPDIVPLLHGYFSAFGHDADVQQAALHTLATGWPEHPDTLPLIHECVADEHEMVRQIAVHELATGWRTHPETLPILHECATEDVEDGVRQTAMQALTIGWRDHPDTLPLLHRCATRDPAETVRGAAIWALATKWPEHPDTLPLIQKCATTIDQWTTLRRVAVQALAKSWTEHSGTHSLLRDCADTDPDGDVRAAAVRAVASGWREEPRTLLLMRRRATTDEHWDVRHVAVYALAEGWRDHPGTLPLLCERADIDPDKDVRKAAVRALLVGWRGHPGAFQVLRRRVTSDDDAVVRCFAMQALATGWGDHSDTLTLLHARAASDEAWFAREVAIEAVAAGWPGHPDTLPLLHRCAAPGSDEAARKAAVRALATGWAEHPDTLPLLRERAKRDQSGDVRWVAAQARDHVRRR